MGIHQFGVSKLRSFSSSYLLHALVSLCNCLLQITSNYHVQTSKNPAAFLVVSIQKLRLLHVGQPRQSRPLRATAHRGPDGQRGSSTELRAAAGAGLARLGGPDRASCVPLSAWTARWTIRIAHG